MTSFLSKVRQSGGKKTRRMSESRTKTVLVCGYPDNETLEGVELELTEKGVSLVKNEDGSPRYLKFKMSPKDASSSDNRPEISDFYAQPGAIQDYINFLHEEYLKIHQGKPSGIVGEMLKDLKDVYDENEPLTMEGFVRKHNRIVEPGGVVQLDRCENRGDYYEVNWIRTLANREGSRLVIPQRAAAYTVYPPKIRVNSEKGSTLVVGDEAVKALNAMNPKEAAEKAIIDVDILLQKAAKRCGDDVVEIIKDQLNYALELGASKGAGVMVRVLAGDTPVYHLKIGIGSVASGMFDSENREIYHVRSAESALERHLAEKRVVGEGDGAEEVLNAEFYSQLLKDGATFEVTPCISTAMAPMEKMNLTKGSSAPGDALMSMATVETIIEMDEFNQPIMETKTGLNGVTEVPKKTQVQLFGVLTNAALTIDGDDTIGYRPSLRYMNYYKPAAGTAPNAPYLYRFIERSEGQDSKAPILKVAQGEAFAPALDEPAGEFDDFKMPAGKTQDFTM